jgi:hypothetical protein
MVRTPTAEALKVKRILEEVIEGLRDLADLWSWLTGEMTIRFVTTIFAGAAIVFFFAVMAASAIRLVIR